MTRVVLVGTPDLRLKYGIGPNRLSRLRKSDEFPQPALHLGNRLLWVEDEIARYRKERKQSELKREAARLRERYGDDLPRLLEVAAEIA